MAVLRTILPFAAVAAVAAAVSFTSPRLAVADAWADLLAVVLCVAPALAGLHVSSKQPLSSSHAALLLGPAVVCLVAIYVLGLKLATVPLQVAALLCAGRAVGGLIGERVAHPGHVLPACVIAAAADCASVLSPEGVSNAIVQSDRALSVVALAAAVPGSDALTFVLGVGDLVIIALLLAVGRKFELGLGRVTLACAAGLAVAFALSAAFRMAIPALVPLGVAANVLVPRFARVPTKDRTAAWIAIGLAAGLVLFVGLRAR